MQDGERKPDGIMNWFRRYFGRKVLHLGGVGRVTPRINYDTGEGYGIGDILMSDWHYISHPVVGGSGGYKLEVDYNLQNFDGTKLPNIRLPRLIRLLKNTSPLISQAGLTFQQFLASGYRIDGNPRAKANIEKILMMLAMHRRKPMPVILSQISDGIFYGGGIYTEVVLAKDRMTTIDFVVADPLTSKFQLHDDDEYGEMFKLIKVLRNGVIVDLDRDPSLSYIPVNGDINSPFGKPFILGALFPSIWQLMLLKDIRDMLRTQIYPFVHIKVDTEKILMASGGDTKIALERAQTAKKTATDAWQNKGTQTAIATGDDVEYSIISGLNRATFGMFDPLIELLSSQISSGTGVQPLFLGINQSTTETNADVQFLIELAIIRGVQTLVNMVMTEHFNYMNQAAGVGGEVYFELLEMNAQERKRKAEVFVAEEEALIKLIDQLSSAFAQGIITMEQMLEDYEKRRNLIYKATMEFE